MSFIGWIVLGLLAGLAARLILPGRDRAGLFASTLLGIVGASVGGWLSVHLLHRAVPKHFYDPATWVSAIVGSLVLLIAYRVLRILSRR
ncbi:GlsB/YeaQ/YmgE family stress response membrane protein [Kitasatospora nipponensis]|uniref:GlsB/YeaQ/YmgE family stress response membrane protein n=1 Tax=Kitasatospora nipponensis TaxID=258049 RepID=A0ABP4HEM7_9ACTN